MWWLSENKGVEITELERQVKARSSASRLAKAWFYLRQILLRFRRASLTR